MKPNHKEKPPLTKKEQQEISTRHDAHVALRQSNWYIHGSSNNRKLIVGEQDHLAQVSVNIEKLCGSLKKSNPELFEVTLHKPSGEYIIEKTFWKVNLLRLITIPYQEFVDAYPYHRFSPFFRVFMRMRPRLMCIHNWNDFRYRTFEELTSIATDINQFIKKLQAILSRKRLLSRQANFRSSGLKNYRSLTKYFRKCFLKRSNLLFIRLDFSYKDGVEQSLKFGDQAETSEVNFNSITAHRDAFFKYLKAHFKKELIGYVWRLEYGQKKKTHYHVVIMLDGALHQCDVSLAKMLGEHWEHTTTNGYGQYFNCNARKEIYKYCMLGKIRIDNVAAWQGIHLFSAYVSLPDLYVKLILPGDHRALGRGCMRAGSLKASGRPPKYKRPEIDFDKFIKSSRLM